MCSVQCARNSIATSSSTSKTCQVGKERNVPEFDIVHGKKVGSSTWEESLSLEVAEEEVSQNCTVRGFTFRHQLTGLQVFWFTSHELWESNISDHFCHVFCTVHHGGSKKWLLEPTYCWEMDSKRSVGNVVPPVRGDEGVDGISPKSCLALARLRAM